MRNRIGWCVAIGLALAADLGPRPNPARGQGAIAFRPVPAAIPDGVNLGVTPAVSADRRYVRLSVGAGFQTVNGFSTLNVPVGAVGGGGLGFAGPGGFPGPGAGGFGFGGPGGIAGMNGPIPGGGGYGPGMAGGFGLGAGAGAGPGGGLSLPGPSAPGASYGSPYASGPDGRPAIRPVPRSKRLRAKAAARASAMPTPSAVVARPTP